MLLLAVCLCTYQPKLGLQQSLSLWSGLTYGVCVPALKMCSIRRCTCTDTLEGHPRSSGMAGVES